jgi:glycosyltransferase involved in cell wall biosynthesis
MTDNTQVCIIIKALNEQDNIERCVCSALAAVEGEGGEVILADSLSTDATVEIASKFPIKIVQLLDSCDRSCGIGAQLGYQYSDAEFVYILDGDMVITRDFIQAALALMREDTDVAGVGGIVQEMNIATLEFQKRGRLADTEIQDGEVDRLNMGGLYRRSALEQAGNYLTNRNLHSLEEFELAIRLRSNGWKLIRLPILAIQHYGYTLSSYTLLKKRWLSGYTQGTGELIRASIGKSKQMSLLLKDLRELKLYIMIMVWWVVIILIPWLDVSMPTRFYFFAMVLLAPFIAMLLKKRNLSVAIYSVVSLQFFTAGTLIGMFKSQKDPAINIRSKLI